MSTQTVERTDRTSDVVRHVADAVRAEIARQKVKHSEVAKALGVSRPTLNSRLNAKSAFGIDELDQVAQLLGFPTLRLIESALFGERLFDPVETKESNEVLPEPDPYAQPPRARARRGGAH
ncbi:helix-turn-helix domain-containing protein [Microbacterium laevaniformans]|uniref:helix-turn-helix domain-containing protein n=1 Tax=Microbacterium laevaniformans TaxID=36807 RepID=UPI003D96A118